MARRSDIDWEQVERLYIAGQLTIRQIADKCNINPSAITRKAKAHNWTRDVSNEVRTLTRAKLSHVDKSALAEESAQECAQKSAQTIKESIEQASDVAAGIVLKHRKEIQSQSELLEQMKGKLAGFMHSAENIKDLESLMRATKTMIEAQTKIVAMQRQAFGLDDKDADNGDDEFANVSDDELTAIASELAAKLGLS